MSALSCYLEEEESEEKKVEEITPSAPPLLTQTWGIWRPPTYEKSKEPLCIYGYIPRRGNQLRKTCRNRAPAQKSGNQWIFAFNYTVCT